MGATYPAPPGPPRDQAVEENARVLHERVDEAVGLAGVSLPALAPVPRQPARAARTNQIEWVLRDWNGMNSIDTWTGQRIPTRRAPNPHIGQQSPWGVEPTIDRGTLGAWDAGTERIFAPRPGESW